MAIGVSVAISMSSDQPMMDMGPPEMDTPTMTDTPMDAMSSELDGTINIGLIFPLSGDLVSHGEERRASSLLAVSDFNDYLAEKGQTWQLNGIVEDTQTNPVIALEKVTSIHAKGANVIVGPASSANLRNLMGYAEANDILLISYSSTAPSLAIPGDNVFRTAPDDNNQGPVISNLLVSRGIEVIVPVWRGDAWGDGIQEATAKAFADAGGMVDDGIRYNPESPEFSTSVSLLADKVQSYVDEYGQDKVGVVLMSFAESLQFMQSAATYDILDEVMWFGTDGNTNEQSIVEDPIGLEFAQTVNFTTVQFAAMDTPAKNRVTEHIMSEFGRTPNVYAYGAYDAVWIAGLAMEAAQSSATPDIREQMLTVAESHVGAVGSTKLNEAGDLASTAYAIWNIQDGKWMLTGNAADLAP